MFEKIENGTNRKILIYSTLFHNTNPMFNIVEKKENCVIPTLSVKEKSTAKLGKICHISHKY